LWHRQADFDLLLAVNLLFTFNVNVDLSCNACAVSDSLRIFEVRNGAMHQR
jgi:hypothetical protein